METMKKCSTCGTTFGGNACPKCMADFMQKPTEGTAQDEDAPLRPGQTFHGLEVVEIAGKGGMGVVYKARQPGLDRFVALKILPRTLALDPEFQARFQREAKALAALSHPNIVSVHDFGAEGDLFFFVMDYVDGLNLRQILRERKLTPEEAFKIVPQLCDALQYAHGEGVVHRDIKPENILIDRKGRIKIADFGLAKLSRASPGAPTLTRTDVAMGTPAYMAPEQLESTKTVDHRADIYSMGVVFYEMLTGELPIGRFAPPSEKVQIDVRLDEVVLRSLEKEPERRYQQASEVKTDVEDISRTRQPPSPGPPAPQTLPPEMDIEGVLNRQNVKAAFQRREQGLAPPPRSSAEAEDVAWEAGKLRVQGPADGLILAGCAALLTALGVGLWLWLKWNEGFLSKLAKGNLVGMAVEDAVYALVIILAGVLMRRLRARLFTLVCVVTVGLFVPAVGALNVVMELKHIPQWPVVIPTWLGVPLAIWATVVLFRRDVRAAYQARKQPRAATPSAT